MLQERKAHKKEKKYSYADYLAWDEEARYELINGRLYDMSPAPNRNHQKISAILFNVLYTYFTKNGCEVYHAPFDVRFPESESGKDEETYTVVQPDICVFCDLSKLDEKGAVGAPDLIVEILSPSTAGKDVKEKRLLYEVHGVPEYWMVHAEESTVEVLKLDKKGKYTLEEYYTVEDEIKLSKEATVKVAELFRG